MILTHAQHCKIELNLKTLLGKPILRLNRLERDLVLHMSAEWFDELREDVVSIRREALALVETCDRLLKTDETENETVD